MHAGVVVTVEVAGLCTRDNVRGVRSVGRPGRCGPADEQDRGRGESDEAGERR